jgi:putative two-component system response regulator
MNSETILVVEDNDILREGLRDILTSEGYTVIAALDGVDAIEQMKTISPDLILSDIAMPRMDGFEFFQAARSRPEWLSIPFIFLTARGEKQDIIAGKNLGVEDYLIKPLTRVELLTAVSARLSRSQELRVAQLQRAYESSLTMLANAIDVRDFYTRGHVERVTGYTMAIAAEVGITGKSLDQLRFGAILHDIGKIITSESTLFKKEPLDPFEWDEIKIHPVTGAEMIKDISFLAASVPVVRHHHERWDGTGYPDRLAGDAIPIGARIVALADSFDAMTIHCPYRDAFSLDQAFQEIQSCTGTRYDPALVVAFHRAWNLGKIHAVRAEWEFHS